jgi:Bacterial Ig-like domain (group 1)
MALVAFRPFARTVAVAATLTAILAVTAPPASAEIIATTDPFALAQSMSPTGLQVTGAGFETIPPLGNPAAVGNSPLTQFPTNGSGYAILSTGQATDADQPEQPGTFPTTALGGVNVRGDTDLDVTILRIDFTVPSVLNCLHFDFKFLSEEFPEYVGSNVNDAFVAEIDGSTWTTAGSQVIAPNNFAFDPTGAPVTINTTGATSMTLEEAAGTPYDGATPVLTAGTIISPGAHSLFLSIFDQGDQVFDSAVFLDRLALTFAPTPADCPSGALVRDFELDVSPFSAVNAPGTSHTVTATLTDLDTGGPVAGQPVSFTVNGANPAGSVEVTTNAAGQATFTYTGVNAGQDVITACFDEAGDGCSPSDAKASAVKTWNPEAPALTLAPPAAGNAVGTTHTVTANLLDSSGVPVSGAAILFTVTGPNPTTGTGTTNAAGNATFSYTANGVGVDTITACYDANGNAFCDIDEVSATATKTWVFADSGLTVEPETATNGVGLVHTVTAIVTDAGGTLRVSLGTVVFTVSGANTAGGAVFSNENGEAEFDYVGRQVGTDTIIAFLDENGNGIPDPGEPSDVVTKTWVPTAIEIEPPTATNLIGTQHTVTATLRLALTREVLAEPAPVLFIVAGANPTSQPLDQSIDDNGQATFTYTGTVLGTDTITVCQDVNANRQCDEGEATATATKEWVGGLPKTGTLLTAIVGSGTLLVLLGAVLLILEWRYDLYRPQRSKF